MLWARVALFFYSTSSSSQGHTPCPLLFFYKPANRVAIVLCTVPHGKETKNSCRAHAPSQPQFFLQEKRAAASRKNTPRPSAHGSKDGAKKLRASKKSSGQEGQAPTKEATPGTRIRAAGSAAGRLKDAAADVSTHGRGWPGNGHKKASHKKKRGRHARTRGAPHIQRRYVRAAVAGTQECNMLQVQEGDIQAHADST